MASFKLILRTERTNSKGEHPLYLRITANRKTSYKSLGINLKEEDWDEDTQKVRKGYPNSVRINNFISTKKVATENNYFEMAKAVYTVESKAIKEATFNPKKAEDPDFFEYLNKQYVFYENQGMVATYDKLKVVEKKLKEYQGSRLAFSEITIDYLKDYRNYLLRDLGNSINTVHANFAKIRLIMNNAIKEGVINGDKNPFRNFKLKWENTKKEFLTEDELYRIENLELNDKHVINHHRNMYVFAAYVGGLRISDLLLLQWKNVDSGIITLRIEKTQAQLSIKAPQKAMEILEFYRTNYKQTDNDFIFPILKNIDLSSKVSKVKAISSATAYANKNLRLIAKKAEINKRITFHTSRHTFATRALKKGIPITHVSKLMGHAQLRETMGYAKIVNEDLDKAMDVFDK